jgi:hypothetical protein
VGSVGKLSVVSFADDVDEDMESLDDDSTDSMQRRVSVDRKVSWHGKEGNRARMRHRLKIVDAARRERWQNWKNCVGNAIGLKWATR